MYVSQQVTFHCHPLPICFGSTLRNVFFLKDVLKTLNKLRNASIYTFKYYQITGTSHSTSINSSFKDIIRISFVLNRCFKPFSKHLVDIRTTSFIRHTCYYRLAVLNFGMYGSRLKYWVDELGISCIIEKY